VYTKDGLACTGACLSGKKKGSDPGTQVTLQRHFLRWLVLLAPLAALEPPLEVLPRIPGVSLPLVHLLHECTINLMDAQEGMQHARNKLELQHTSALFKSLHKKGAYFFSGREVLT
jgi:hypothetical protein